MESTDLKQLWSRIVERLGEEVPSSQVAYLKTARLEDGEGEDLDLQLPSRFAEEKLREHHLDEKIRRALRDEGQVRPLRFSVVRPRRRRQELHPDQGHLRFVEGGEEGAAPRAAPVAPPANLNPKYTMRDFVVGDGNRLAHAVCEAVAGSPGKVYNPVFIYGGVGLGKTHLMQAVGHAVHAKDPTRRILYVSSEVFVNDYIWALKEGRIEQFRARHRQADLLMIDDIQFLEGKERTQDEFFHTFNELYQTSRQIMLTSDRSPKQLSNLEERLVSRFESGVVADIRPPDVETRLAILYKLAEAAGLEVLPGTLEVLAERIRSNIRQLEGALNRVIASCSLERSPVTMEIVEEVVAEYGTQLAEEDRKVRIPLIQDLVCEYFHLSREDLCGRRRTRNVVVPRQVAMFLSHELTEETLEQIARAFGKKDHTTVLHACDKIRKLVGKDAEMDAALRTLRGRIRSVVEG